MVALALSLLLTAPPPAPPPEPPRAVMSWTCFAGEQIDQHVSGMVEMLVYPDGSRDSLSYYLNWAQQPRYMAEQQMSWVWIPPAANCNANLEPSEWEREQQLINFGRAVPQAATER